MKGLLVFISSMVGPLLLVVIMILFLFISMSSSILGLASGEPQQLASMAKAAVEPIEAITPLQWAYKMQLKKLASPSVGMAVAVARINSYQSGSSGNIRFQDPSRVLEALSPTFHYVTVQTDTVSRKVTTTTKHSIQHKANSEEVEYSAKRLPSYQLMKIIETPTGTIELFHTIKFGNWEIVKISSDEITHPVILEGKEVKCTMTVLTKVEERKSYSVIDDLKLPRLGKDSGKIDSVLAHLGIKGVEGIKLVKAMAEFADSGEIAYGGVGSVCGPCVFNYEAFQQFEWRWPIPNYSFLSSTYGPRWGGFHHGIDVPAPIGTPVIAPQQGTVAYLVMRWAMGRRFI